MDLREVSIPGVYVMGLHLVPCPVEAQARPRKQGWFMY